MWEYLDPEEDVGWRPATPVVAQISRSHRLLGIVQAGIRKKIAWNHSHKVVPPELQVGF